MCIFWTQRGLGHHVRQVFSRGSFALKGISCQETFYQVHLSPFLSRFELDADVLDGGS